MVEVPPTALGVNVVIRVIVIIPGLGDSGAVGWTYIVADMPDGTTVSGHGIPEGPTVTVIVPGIGGIVTTGVGVSVGPGVGLTATELLSVTVRVESRNGLIPREKSC